MWDEDWPTALRWAEASRGTVTARRLHSLRRADGEAPVTAAAPALAELAAGLPAGSAVLMLTALSQHTVDSNDRDELPQPEVEPGVLAMLLTPDGASIGASDPSRAQAFRQWAAKSLDRWVENMPLDAAIDHAVNVVLAANLAEGSCYHKPAAQVDALRQLYDLLVDPVIGHVPRDARHLIIISDQVRRHAAHPSIPS